MKGKILSLFSVVIISVFICTVLFAGGMPSNEPESAMDRIRAKLKEFGWRVMNYESQDKELWGNRGIAPGGYIVGGPPAMEETKMAVSPQMLDEKDLRSLESELSRTMNTVKLEREQRKELEYYLSQVESQLNAYKEQFEVIGGTTYTVQKDDSLWKIAKKEYGDPYKWPIIYRANEAKVSNPNLIYPGQTLTIPQIKVKR